MGLLDKVENAKEEDPKKAVAKKATPKKAVAKKATPKKAVAKKAVAKAAKPAKAKREKPKREREPRIRPSGLPEGYELAGKMPRYIGWLINFAWNFGVIIGVGSIMATGANSDLTIVVGLGGLMVLFNWLVMPIWTGRNIGEFVSRTKYINSSGNKPIPVHAILNNSLGFLSLFGVFLMFSQFQFLSSGGMPLFITGVVLIIIWVVNFFFKRNSDYTQGLFDLAFSSYLVKHVSTGDETGWLARFEALGDFGDKWQEKQAQRQEKAKAKAEKKAQEAADKSESKDNNDEASVDDESESETSSED
tara:strand:- start:405 stop:1316 length:912 start_codon:yes stop_codon:yes gene_type:complete